MAKQRKMVRIDGLPEGLRKQVEEHAAEEVRRDRLEQLVVGNRRLLDALDAVWFQEGEDPGETAFAIVSEAVGKYQGPRARPASTE